MLASNKTNQSNIVWSLADWESVERRTRERALAESSERAAWLVITREVRSVMRAYTTSFFIVSRFLPATKRAEVEVVYAAVRYPDEIVDTFPLRRDERLRKLDEWGDAYEEGLVAASMREALRRGVPCFLASFTKVVRERYGLPFGRYAYTGVLQPTVFGVPLVMACAWIVLVAYVQQVRLRLHVTAWGGALIAAVLMTMIDLVIDPLAANQLGYWRWVEPGSYYGIPSSNFVGWFVCSLSIFVLFRQQKWQPNFWHRLTGASIILFFTLIALSFQLYVAALVGLGLCVVHFLLFFDRREHSN